MKILKKNLQIAIDGPVAAGKSNIAQKLSKKLGKNINYKFLIL